MAVKEYFDKEISVPDEEAEFAGVICSREGLRRKAAKERDPRPRLVNARQPLREVASRFGVLLGNIRVRSALSPAINLFSTKK